MIKCELCNREFESLRSLGLHLSHSHKGFSHKEYYDKYLKNDSDGVCPVCGKPTRWKGGLHGYARTCSVSCGQKHPETRQKLDNTNLERYGATNPYGSIEIREKIKKHNLEKLGVENPFQQPNVQKKAIHNSHTEDAEHKRQITCLNKYGNKYHIASKEVRQKAINTYQEKYGVSNAYSIPKIHEKALNHSLASHQDNGNHSSWETLLENALITKSIVYKKQYKDSRYPYYCDFYLVDSDTFIEINGFWMHGKHYFDINNTEDINKLKIWKSKSDNRMYQTAINVWTKSDIEKRNIALQQNLTYIVLWTINDIHEFIKSL